MMFRPPLLKSSFILLLICFCLFVSAQATPEQLLAEATAKVEAAKVTYNVATYDQPLWREAILQGHTALDLAPNNPNALHFLATSYAYVNWHSRSWQNWQAYFDVGGTLEAAKQLNSDSEQLLENAGTELGFARYEASNLEAALPFYEQVLTYLPDNQEALRWLGRIHLELNQPAEALPYWERLAEVNPNAEGVQYYVTLSSQQSSIGIEASEAFQKGLQAYDKGQPRTAILLFEKAVSEAPQFKDAFAWLGRIYFELDQYEKASGYWQNVLELDPEDERAAYFARYSSDRTTWGTAADAFYEGQALHLQNNWSEAVLKFEEAFRLNPKYKDAAVWAGRTYLEIEQPTPAIPYWQAVLQLDPSDKRAVDFLRLAETQSLAGIEAGNLFLKGVAAFESADLMKAEALFLEALEANGNFPPAWAWLGRVHFSSGDYVKSAQEYGKAYQLDPNNDGYRFFANESLRLQSPEDSN